MQHRVHSSFPSPLPLRDVRCVDVPFFCCSCGAYGNPATRGGASPDISSGLSVPARTNIAMCTLKTTRKRSQSYRLPLRLSFKEHHTQYTYVQRPTRLVFFPRPRSLKVLYRGICVATLAVFRWTLRSTPACRCARLLLRRAYCREQGTCWVSNIFGSVHFCALHSPSRGSRCCTGSAPLNAAQFVIS